MNETETRGRHGFNIYSILPTTPRDEKVSSLNEKCIFFKQIRLMRQKIKSSYQLIVQEIENVRKDLALYSNMETISETNFQIFRNTGSSGQCKLFRQSPALSSVVGY